VSGLVNERAFSSSPASAQPWLRRCIRPIAGEVFQAVRKSPSSSFAAFLTDLPPQTKPPRPPAETAVWDKLLRSLGAISQSGLADRELQSFADWIPVVAEFTFHPWQELLAAETRS
jgi:hypothetical protein